MREPLNFERMITEGANRRRKVVREAPENVQLYTPHYGRIEMRARPTDDPRSIASSATFVAAGYHIFI